MPKVGNKHFSYDAKGMSKAKNAAKASGKPMQMMGGGKAMKYKHGGSVEVDGVMQEHYRKLKAAPMSGGTESGKSRGGGAALRGTIFRGVK